MSNATKFALAVAVVASLAAALLVVGRGERSRWADDENATIAAITADVGDLDSPGPAAFRDHGDFRCLAWRRGNLVFALELCYDGSGRVIEALDRRGTPRLVFGSLRAEPSAARTRIDVRLATRLFERLAAPGS